MQIIILQSIICSQFWDTSLIMWDRMALDNYCLVNFVTIHVASIKCLKVKNQLCKTQTHSLKQRKLNI